MSTTHSPPTPPSTPPSARDRAAIRARFPALDSPTAFLENAGGSQVPGAVADALRDYMLSSYVQLDAGYPESDRADQVVADAHAFMNRFVNGEGIGEAILGPSTSQLVAMLADAYGRILEPGDEVVVVETGHEANIGPWARLADRGLTVHTWRFDESAWDCPLDGLDALLNERTRIVAVVHVSNLLGKIVDCRAIAERVHARCSARVVVDGVAFAPHRAIDVADLGADWYAFSTYKVYGPHMGVLFGRHEALAELTGPNHFFIPKDEVPYKFELGGVNHEGCAALLALRGYLTFLAELDGSGSVGPGDAGIDRATIERAGAVMEACERPLQAQLLDFLERTPGFRVIGPPDGPDRVGTVSFVHERLSSADLVAAAHAEGVACRNGHMYAYHLCEALGLDPDDGVVRVSLLHYNTPEEIDRAIAALAKAVA